MAVDRKLKILKGKEMYGSGFGLYNRSKGMYSGGFNRYLFGIKGVYGVEFMVTWGSFSK